MKITVSQVFDPSIENVYETDQETRLTLPPKMDKNSYIKDIEILLNFVESNDLILRDAKRLFRDASDMLGYRKCNFNKVKSYTLIKANGQPNSRIKFSIYQDHDISSFVSKYELYYAPFSLTQAAYFEMLLQLDDFITEQGLTVKQAQNLYSDCTKMLFESK